MAQFTMWREEGKQAQLMADVSILSRFRWKAGVLETRLYAALGLGKEESRGVPKVEARQQDHGFTAYRVSWPFCLSSNGSPDENELRLQCQASDVLAVFDQMEEKVKAARAVEKPLSWLVEADEAALVEVCCSRPPSVPLEELKQDLACMMAIGAGGG